MREVTALAPGLRNRLKVPGLRTVNRLSPEDWLNATEGRLVNGGIDAVKSRPLAVDLNVTRGSFYWHFRDRNHLLQTLLARWRALVIRRRCGRRRGRSRRSTPPGASSRVPTG